MVKKKRKSKRTKLKDKYKIQKKIKEHRRKMNKLAKKNPHLRPRKKKDPGVPMLFPGRDKIIRDAIQMKKNQKEEEKQEKKKEKRT